jgi:hypothetical protein
MEQKETIMTVGAGHNVIHTEPKVLVPKGIVLYYRGKEVGSADITVDFTNIPEDLHQLVLSIASQMRNSFHIDGLVAPERKPPEPPKESWWRRWKKKSLS